MSTPKPASLRTDTLADSVLILLSLMVVQRLVGFVRAVLFCRWLDPEQLGQWDMAFSFLLLAGPMVVLSLTGAFGRYVEHYRQRRQLRVLLRRIAAACVGMGVAAFALLYLFPGWFSILIFGAPDHAHLVGSVAWCLLAVIGFNYFVDLFNGLRNVRLIAGLQLVNSLAFAALGLGLLAGWQCTAESVILAYGGACVVSALGAAGWLAYRWHALPEDGPAPRHRELWPKLLGFTTWMWLNGMLTNLFDVADRYMIMHFSHRSAAEALTQVGNYHSSRLVPLLLATVAMLLGSMLTPHLSHDWEAGRRQQVVARLNLFMKLIGFTLCLGAVAVLLAAPFLFGVAFRGKFAGGEAVLPWTLTYCIWFGMWGIAQNYLWCVEKARLGTIALLAGIGVNVVLNYFLLPRLGLHGAVLATAAANLLTLVLILTFSWFLGFHVDRGTRLILAVPAVISLGPWVTLAVLVAVVFEAITTERVLSADEKEQLLQGWHQYRQRFQAFRMATKTP
jgi:O-antigen/teichoic acid export membrane protein